MKRYRVIKVERGNGRFYFKAQFLKANTVDKWASYRDTEECRTLNRAMKDIKRWKQLDAECEVLSKTVVWEEDGE